MAFTNEWDETKPQDSEKIGLGAGRIRELKKAVRERLAVDHDAQSEETSSDIGKHKQISLIEKTSAPSTPTAGNIMYDKSGKLYLKDKDGTEKEIINNTDDQTVNGVKTFGSFPITPETAPTEDYEVVNKKYVDDKKIQIYGAIGNTNINTSSTSFADIPGLSITETFMAGNVFISVSMLIRNPSYATIGVRIVVDGVAVTEHNIPYDASSYITTRTVNPQFVANLTAGKHTIKVQWKTSIASRVLYQDGATDKRVLTIIG